MKEHATAIVDVLLENDEFAAQAAQASYRGAAECAWCNEERGRPPTPGASHGICMRHYAQALRAQGMPEEAIQAKVQDKVARGVVGAIDQGPISAA